MILVFVSLIFYVVDPMLGVIVALVLPSALALDTTGEYSSALVSIIFAVAMYFIRKTAFSSEE